MKNNNENSWVPFPRKIRADRLDGLITPSECDLYLWLRLSANPYGIASISFEGLVADFAQRGWSKNHLNRLVLSLKTKRYLHYEARSGRRGSFQVRFADFLVPGGGITELKDLNKSGLGRGVGTGTGAPVAEEPPDIPASNQSFESYKDDISKLVQQFSMDKDRGSNNDTETKKENKINRCNEEERKDMPVSRFNPQSYEEQQCKEIALELGEKTMDFLLGTRHKHGMGVIEEAWGEWQRMSGKKKQEVENRAAYFNGIVESILTLSGKK